jgi:glycine cleavage system transcriptional repressor
MAVNEIAVTVIGHDRPGIIADVTEILARLGLNLTDSTMTRLRGHFAMTLVCAGPPGTAEVEAALEPIVADGNLTVSVRRVVAEASREASGTRHEAGGNISDLSTRLSGPLYVVVAEVDLPSTVDSAALGETLRAVAQRLGVEATLRAAEVDVL